METKVVVGIDISKDSFDVALPLIEKAGYQHLKFNNTQTGYKKLCAHLPIASHCVMEASGVYYLPLAVYLHQQGMRVSVVNPLTIKRFAQMRLMRAKTDKKDAAIIAEYGKVENPVVWQPRAEHMLQMQQLQALQDSFTGQLTRLTNQQKTFQSSGVENKFAHHLLVIEIKHVKKQIALLQNELVRLTQAFH
jgi:transposase